MQPSATASDKYVLVLFLFGAGTFWTKKAIRCHCSWRPSVSHFFTISVVSYSVFDKLLELFTRTAISFHWKWELFERVSYKRISLSTNVLHGCVTSSLTSRYPTFAEDDALNNIFECWESFVLSRVVVQTHHCPYPLSQVRLQILLTNLSTLAWQASVNLISATAWDYLKA